MDNLRDSDIIDCPFDSMGHADRMIHAPLHSFSPFPSYTTFNKIKVIFTGGRQIPQTTPNWLEFFLKGLQFTKKCSSVLRIQIFTVV